MPITTMSSRDFNHESSRAKRAALDGPVIITERGKPAHVLMSFDEYRRLTATSAKIADLLAMPDMADLEIPSLKDMAQAADLS